MYHADDLRGPFLLGIKVNNDNNLIGSFKSLIISLHEKCTNTEFFFWSVLSCIQPEYRKIRTRKYSVFGHFSRSVCDRFAKINCICGISLVIFRSFPLSRIVNINFERLNYKAWSQPWSLNLRNISLCYSFFIFSF